MSNQQIPPRILARDAVARFLGQGTGNATQEVAGLEDEEVQEIILASADKQTARQQIKDVFTRAYDRRRRHAAGEAQSHMDRMRRSSRARGVLERELAMSFEQSIAAVAPLEDATLDAIGELQDLSNCADQCRQLLGQPAIAAEPVAEAAPESPPADVESS